MSGDVVTEWGMIASYAGETLPGEWISDRDEYVPGTTPTTGAQVAYALATPTTTPVTPTNLPIKSLSGYTHIESSTGEMEIEYIRNTYQPLVDLIQSGNGHTYSTSEQVVGKWIDGSDIYEKTVDFGALPNNTTKSVAHGIGNIDMIVSCSGMAKNSSGTQIPIPYVNTAGVSYQSTILVDNTNVQIITGSDLSSYSKAYVILRYTKSTQTRSFNAPVNTQKAQIEPLEEKGEELPTEEEKTVEMPVVDETVDEPIDETVDETEEKSDER